MGDDDKDELKERWTHLYRDHLPSLAKARDPVQQKWPVFLDHCFARIVLDNAVGRDKPWTEVVKAPAVKHMSTEQFQSAISLAESIATGDAVLNELNERSLRLRNKKRRGKDDASADEGVPPAKVMKRESGSISTYFLPSPSSPPVADGKSSSKPKTQTIHDDEDDHRNQIPSQTKAMDKTQLRRIADSNLTPFRKLTLSMLCQIPRGSYSTYQAMADHITATSHKTCARAVGNAMRNNPFAPEVPCHRILAADGSLGGFKGSWGENGKFADSKRKLLAEEGVRFDSRGKVKGPVFRGFWKLETA